jgi:hypothetical protein
MPMAYYEEALTFFPGDMPVTVYSDDIEWCKTQFNGQWHSFSEGRSPLEDLLAMSRHEHQIIANSTFSWWAAYINKNPDKFVVSPSADNWFAGTNKRHNTKDLIPAKWHQIKFTT